jgi:hypothetical protein
VCIFFWFVDNKADKYGGLFYLALYDDESYYNFSFCEFYDLNLSTANGTLRFDGSNFTFISLDNLIFNGVSV